MAESLTFSIISQLFQNNYTDLYTAGLLVFATILILYWKFTKKGFKLPPGPTGIPILGYLPFLGPEPYKDLDRLKEKYGNVFGLYMGRTSVVILGDYEAVKDAFSKPTTVDRPEGLFDFLPDAVGLSSVNGLEWVEQRRFCMKSLRDLGVGKNNWETIIQVEVEDFIKLVSSFNGQPVDISQILTSSVSNNISSFVFGRRLPLNHPDRLFLDAVLDDAMQSFKQSASYNFFPFIRDICAALGFGEYGKVHQRLKKFNNFVRNEAEKIKKSYKSEGLENFIVDYLREMNNNKDKPGHYFNDRNLHGNVQALFLAASDTTRTSIQWLILIMANFSHIQSKVHQEIDSVLGKNMQLQWSDRKKLPYIVAVIMEGQRWRTTAPLNTARIATEDIQIQGYDIPKGTTITANNWGLHHDKRYWKDPENFDPERFLTEDGKQVITKPESYVPFSFGKRGCPGETIAMMEMLLYFTALMQKFTILPPHNTKPNMNGILGLTFQVERQELRFVPRE